MRLSTKQKVANAAAPCRHCGRQAKYRRRGLCYRCLHTPEISRYYPSESKYAPKCAAESEPDAAEVERIVAEQLPTMPGKTPAEITDEEGAVPEYEPRVVRTRQRRRVRKTIGAT